MVFLSVVTVCKNAATTLERTIQTVMSQDFQDMEYLVIDGASTDGTREILERYTPRLRYLSQPDAGYTDALNTGLAEARGRWIHFLNADDVYTSPTALSTVVGALRSDVLNYTSLRRSWPDGSYKPLPWRYETRFPVKNRRWPFWITSSMLHPTMIISAAQYACVGPYDTRWRYAADTDMILRLLAHYPPQCIPQTIVAMQQGGMAQQHRHATAAEFARITIERGLPSPLAWSVYGLKMHLLWPLFLRLDRRRIPA